MCIITIYKLQCAHHDICTLHKYINSLVNFIYLTTSRISILLEAPIKISIFIVRKMEFKKVNEVIGQ